MKPYPKRDKTHTFDESMRCIVCRRPYAEKAEPCGRLEDRRALGHMARSNAYREKKDGDPWIGDETWRERESRLQRERRARKKQARLAAMTGMMR